MINPPLCITFPEIFLTFREASPEANPAKAERPTVLPIVRTYVPPSDRIVININLLTCFHMFVFASQISILLFKLRFLFSLLTIFFGTQCIRSIQCIFMQSQ